MEHYLKSPPKNTFPSVLLTTSSIIRQVERGVEIEKIDKIKVSPDQL